MLLIFFVLCSITHVLTVHGAQQFEWNTVAIGGGGYVTGLVQIGNSYLYARTDVGGMYRFNDTTESWKPLLDFYPVSHENLYGVDSIAVSPHSTNIIYASLGEAQWTNLYAVLKSTDYGNSWKQLSALDNVVASSNNDYRWSGERLIVHPNSIQNNTVYFGSRMNGLLMTNDGGNTWNQISSFPFKNSTVNGQNMGIMYVNINPFNYDIYVSLFNYGVYRSKDDGKTWTNIVAKLNCLRSTFNTATNDNLFYTTCTNGVFRYNPTNNEWLDISPIKDGSYGGIDISSSGDNIIVAEQKSGYNCRLYVAAYNNNIKWNEIQHTTLNDNVPWYDPNQFSAATATFIFDDRSTNKAILSDWFQVWFNNDILSTDNTKNIWYTREHGFEELEPVALSSPTKGAPLLSGVADCEGFRHIDITKYPARPFHGYSNSTFWTQSTLSIDFCESNPNIILRIAGGEPNDEHKTGAISTDNGQHWTLIASAPPAASNGLISGSIAISPTNCGHMVWCPLSNVPYVTNNSGKTWSKSTGAVAGICGNANNWEGGIYTRFGRDGINGNYYYMIYEKKFYVSSDGGYSWKVTLDNLPSPSSGYKSYLSSDFAIEGNVCVCFGYNGIYCTNDYGKTFNKIDGVGMCRLVTFGRSETSMSGSVMYIFGISSIDMKANAPEGMYYNDNATFVRMNNDSFALGNGPRIMIGDRQTFGRVYIGSSGRGVYYSSAL